MKKLENVVKALMLSILMVAGLSSYAQNPTYSMVAKNDTLLNSKVYQFDIYLYQTGTTDFYLNNFQLSFKITNSVAILNGGLLSGSYVSGSSQLPIAFIPSNMNIMINGSFRLPRINGPSFSQSGALIPASGLRVGTFRILDTTNYGQSPMTLIWWNTVPATTQVYAIVPPAPTGTSVNITDMAFHTKNFTDPILNKPLTIYDMTGGGSYCSGGTGATVGLSGSEIGVMYRLVKNGVGIGWDIPGTGAPLSFGPQTAGTYICAAYRDATYIRDTMNNSATTAVGVLLPVITGNASICAGATGEVYTTASGMTNYVWSAIGGTIVGGQSTNTVTINWGTSQPASVSVSYNDNGCIPPSPTNFPVVFTSSASTNPVSISASTNPICPGSSTLLSVNGGSLGTGAEWTWYTGSCGGTIIGTGSSITVFPPGNTTYFVRAVGTCNTTGCASITITIGSNLVAKDSIYATPSGPVCPGTSVTFTSISSNGGTSPIYQWKIKHGIVTNVGTNSITYSNSSLVNGDTVICVLTSNDPCASGSPVTSNLVKMIVFQNLIANISIIKTPTGPVCSGSTVDFNANISNGGTSPVFQWKVNGLNVGTNTSAYSSSTLTNGQVVTCILTSNALCVTGSPDTSNKITMIVNQSVNAGISVSANPPGAICPGTNVIFNAIPVNGGSSPSYQWMLNSAPVGTGTTYSNSTLVTGDTITCILTSNASCASGSPATSSPLAMVVTQTVSAGVSIIATPPGPICAGTSVNFTATPVNGGTSPSYQWQLNGVNAGANSSTFSPSPLSNSDGVTCIMTSNNSCATGSPATSNPITMTVNQNVPVSVSITSNPIGAICAGTNVGFTATPTNEGSSPVYQWQVNAANVGTNTSTYSSTAFANGNVVTCILTSNVQCTTGSPATSYPITMMVNPLPSVQLGSDPALCIDNFIILDAGPGFSHYTWSNDSITQSILVDSSIVGIGTWPFYVEVEDANGCTASDTIYVTFASCVGIPELANDLRINYYPNPTKGMVNIYMEGMKQSNIELSLVNVYSQLIYRERISNNSGNILKHFDLSNYPKGVYYLKINAGNKVYGGKIIVD